MNYRPSDSYVKIFTTSNPLTGAATDADSPPVATANKNGTDDLAFSLTVAKIDTGRYKITGTVPSGYAANDIVNITVAATCSAIAGKACVDSFYVVAKRSGDATQVVASVTGAVVLPAIPVDWLTASGVKADAVTKIQSGLSTYAGGVVAGVTAPVTVGTNNDKTGYALATAPPTAVAIRTEMDSNSTKLANLDAAISSRMATFTLPTNFAALGISVGGKISGVVLTDECTTNTDMRGTDSAYIGTPPTVIQIRSEMDANSTKLANITGDAFARLGAPVGASISADIQTRSTFAGGSVASVTAPVTVGTNNDKTGYSLTQAYDPSITAAQAGDAMALSSGERDTLVAMIFDYITEGATTFVQVVRGWSSALMGKASGLETTTATYASLAGNKNRITAAVDEYGNRSSVGLDLD